MTRTKTNLTVKIISFLLTLILVFYAIPSIVYAEAIDALGSLGGEESETDVRSAAISDKDAYEMSNLRTESTKTFKLPDGSFVAAQYPSAVHRKDSDGAWQDIDNSLAASGSEISTKDARVKFAKKITGNETLFTLHENNTKITFSLNGAIKKTAGEIIKLTGSENAEDTKLSKLMTLENLSSKIVYANILDGVDLEYVLNSNNIKENIIVKEKKESYVYSFEIKLNNLLAELSGKDILIKNSEGETAYVIPAPIIFDSNGVYAPESVGSYALISHGNGSYTLTVTADALWMNSAERAFPITVDPTVSTAKSNTLSLFVDESAPNTSYSNAAMLKVGTNSYAYWKLYSLGNIPINSIVEEATLSLHHDIGVNGYIGAYRVLSDWDNTLTWNKVFSEGQGTVSPYNISYNETSASTINNYFNLDITKAVKEWIAAPDSNYGVAIKYTVGDGTTNYFSGARSSTFPVFTAKYRNISGLEDYYTYYTHSLANGIAGNVNLATGGLVLTIPTLTATDSIFSYTPTLVYDTGRTNYFHTYTNAEVPYRYLMAHLGFKWNMQQSVIYKQYATSPDTLGELYVWCDADGTEHYFYETGTTGIFADEDGLLLELEQKDGKIKITDKSETELIFTAGEAVAEWGVSAAWCLNEIKDAVGNKLIFNLETPQYRPIEIIFAPNGGAEIVMLKIYYDGDFPYLVYNEVTHEAVILRRSDLGGIAPHNEKWYLKEVAYARGGSEVSIADWFSYYENEANSSGITLNSKSVFEYCEGGQIRKIMDTESGYAVNYVWSNNKLVQLTEYANSQQQGQSAVFTYNSSNTFVATSGNDDVIGTGDDAVISYTFDSKGRVIGTYSNNAAGELFYGASSQSFESQENIKNNIKEQIVLGGTSSNYILNGAFEKKSGNNAEHWNKTANVSFINSACNFNVMPSVSDSVTQYLYLPNGEYTLAFDLGTYDSYGTNAKVEIRSLLNSQYSVVKSFGVSDDETSIKDRVTLHFNVNTNDGVRGDKLAISFVVSGASSVSEYASVTIDNVMLTESIGSMDYSMVEMGGFEPVSINSSGQAVLSPASVWEMNGAASSTYYAYEPFGNCAIIYASISEERYIKQRIYDKSDEISLYVSGMLPSNAENKYIISGYGCAAEALDKSESSFRLRADVYYYQKQNGSNVKVSHYFDFSPYNSSWQYISGSFSTSEIPKEQKISGANYDFVTYIDVFCEYSYQPNTCAVFDNISVVSCNKSNIRNYTYHENGLLKSSSNFFDTEYYYYSDDGKHNLVKKVNNDGELFEYTYNENRTLSSEIFYTFENVNGTTEYPWESKDETLITKVEKSRTDYSYNTAGQCVQELTSSAGEKNICNSYTYSTEPRIYGALIRETDSLGKSVRYFYNSSNGKLLATVNEGSGDGVCYSYDGKGNLVSVRPASSSTSSSYSSHSGEEEIEYVYNAQNLLTEIITESTTYHFVYDGFGNTTSVSAGNNNIVSYEYNSYNGKLKKLTYANGLSEEYEYNALEILETIWYNKDGVRTKAYSYEYTNKGILVGFVNHLAGEAFVYTYNADGRLLSATSYALNDLYDSYSEKYTYTDKDELWTLVIGVAYKNSGVPEVKETSYTYTYDMQGRITNCKIETDGTPNKKLSYTYDNYGRLTGKTSTGAGFNSTVNYAYTETSTKTSGEVKSYTSTVNGSIVTYNYEYDSNGNITKINIGTNAEIRYVYDGIGQLIREDNGLISKTYIYTYDNAGNILSSLEYELTNEGIAPTVLTGSESYGYSSGAWGDMLTSYNGHVITYDELGNPLTYYNGQNYTFTWRGRQMTSLTKDGVTYYFEYDDEGHRVKKTKGSEVTCYYYSGDRLIAEICNEEYLIVYLYDENGSPIGFQYHEPGTAKEWNTFWYEKNLQGDVVALYNDAGVKLATYTYDAWGNATANYADGAENLYNPFGYRGYYYDYDVDLYYLGTRYYDSATSRFLSPDTTAVLTATPMALTDKNLYAYCDNNPITRVDHGGEFWITLGIMGVGALIGGAISAASSAIIQKVTTGEVNWKSVGVAAASGFLSGALSASPLGVAGQAIGSGVIDGLSYIADSHINKTEATVGGVLSSAGTGMFFALLGGKGANYEYNLTNVIKDAKSTIKREARRANQKYAQKAVARAVYSRNNILAQSAWSASIGYAKTLGASNIASGIYNYFELKFFQSAR